MTKRKCSVWWCDKPHYANGYCKAHDTAVKRYGTPYGKHEKQWDRVNNELLKARLIAIRVTEFVGETEFEECTDDMSPAAQEFNRIAQSSKQCPFCQNVDTHAPLCIVNLSKTLLQETYPYGD